VVIRTGVVGLVGVFLSFCEPGRELFSLLFLALVSLVACALGADGSDATNARHDEISFVLSWKIETESGEGQREWMFE
jgi:hypothetical protein